MPEQIGAEQQEQVKKFARLAAEYCSFLEDHCAYSTKQFIRQSADYLAAIEQQASELRDDGSAAEVKIDPGPTGWIARNASEKLGNQGQVADQLTNIYRYLKQGALAYQSDPASAVSHWGSKFSRDCRAELKGASEGLQKLLSEGAQ
jgi:hypothetical protein